jgi:hypothetical protein
MQTTVEIRKEKLSKFMSTSASLFLSPLSVLLSSWTTKKEDYRPPKMHQFYQTSCDA